MGPFIVKNTLGEGGFSKVKRGVHEETGEQVALKILKAGALDESARKQVEREITALMRVEHPNVLRLRHVDWKAKYPKTDGSYDTVLLLVLELARGGELFEFLSFTGAFEEAIARTYFHQLVDGLIHCHAQNVVHRDLKPENLLLDENFALKIADFGLSGTMDMSSNMYTQCGTIGYMAPEMAGGAAYDARKVDIWSTGVIVFIMIAGFPPFQKPSVSDWWFHKLKNNRHDLFWRAHSRTVYFSDDLKDLINKMLCPDPSLRISMEQIRETPWWKGAVIDREQVYSELLQRKQQVDQEKLREKMEKHARENGAAVGVTAMEGVTAADRDLGDETFPDMPPSMEFFSHGIGKGAAAGADLGVEMGMGGDMMDNSGMGFEDETESHAEAQPFEEISACYTRLESPCGAGLLYSKVLAFVRAATKDYSAKESQFKVKAKVLTENGLLVFTAQVLKDPAGKTHHVVLQRLGGDGMQFRAIFAQLRAQMKEMLVTP